MNGTVIKGMLRTLKAMIPPEQIKEAANSMITEAINFKNNIPLTDGEREVVGVLYEVDNHVYCGVAVLDSNNHITRFENIRRFDEVVENLINKM
jgi:small nuclear ribonucleoprotein (snRNP)-like protein